MNRLPGNDFAKQFDSYEGGLEVEAVMALAFEQRTANLIAYASHLGQTSNHSAMSVLEDQVDSRLGLGGKEESNG